MHHADIFIIGGGAAGLAAAKAAVNAGCKSVALADTKMALGGVLLQCAHTGFSGGLTGVQYAAALTQELPAQVRLFLGTTVLRITENKTAILSGGQELSFSQLIYAAGCLEISMGALGIAGTRPRGVFTAGQMQEMMNLHGVIPEGPVVILGSGDIGLIMAAQIAALGIAVTLVEQASGCGALARNRRCLEEYPIHLLCSQTITNVEGFPALTGCRLSGGSFLPCRTLLIAAGLRPDRSLIAELGSPPWLHLCGNCHFVHTMVESVTAEGRRAGLTAEKNLRGDI